MTFFKNLEFYTDNDKQHRYHRNQKKKLVAISYSNLRYISEESVLFQGTNCSKCQHEYTLVLV